MHVFGVMATSRRSRWRFLAEGLEGILVAPAAALSWPLTRVRLDNWGATRRERERGWAGDDLVDGHPHVHTRATTIEAPAEAVWPWLVQLGLGKAGFYSYELLERLVGIPVVNLERIEPSFQSLGVGDEIVLHPKAPGIPVAYVEPSRHVCFGVRPGPDVKPEDRARSWCLYIEPIDDRSCRLVARSAIVRPEALKARVALAMTEPIDFVMEQRMLRTLKRLAEQNHSERC